MRRQSVPVSVSVSVGRRWVASGSPVGRRWVAGGWPVGRRWVPDGPGRSWTVPDGPCAAGEGTEIWIKHEEEADRN